MHGNSDQMHVELQVALNFIISYLYNKLPRTRIHLYGEELEKLLRVKFNGHWYPSNPMKGSAFRCVHFNSAEIDPSFETAAVRSGLDFVNDIKHNLPSELSVWVDPGEVSYAIGGPDGKPGPVKVLFKQPPTKDETNEAKEEQIFSSGIQISQQISAPDSYMTFNPHAKDFLPKAPVSAPIDNGFQRGNPPMASHTQQRIAPSNFNYSLRPAKRLYTVDEFASTKFGSTKMKSNARNLTPFQWTQQQAMEFPGQAPNFNNDSSVFPMPPVGFQQPTSPIDNQMHLLLGHNRPSSLTTSSSFSESSSGSSASSSPDHVKGQLMKASNQIPVSPTRATWGDSFTLPNTTYKPLYSWPTDNSSNDIPSPQEDFLSFAGLSDFSPFGTDHVQMQSTTNRMMSMAN